MTSSDGEIKARLHKGDGGTYLWVLNPSRASREVTISLMYKSEIKEANDLWAGIPIAIDKNSVTLTIGDRDAVVIKLQ